MARKVRVTIERTLPTFARLRSVSWYSFKLANKFETGRFLNLMTSILFSAFCLEAFLNHVGQDKISFWKPLKRKLSALEKLEVISNVIKFKPDFSRRPFQNFKPIFSLRDDLVHAETLVLNLNGDYLLEDGEEPPEPLASWEVQINMINGQRYLDDTKEMIQQIAKSAGYDPETILNIETVETVTRNLGDTSMPSS